MKIVCIAASFIPSNTANSIQVVKVAHALAELGHDVALLVPGERQAEWDDLKRHYGLRAHFEIDWIPENLAFRRYDYTLKAVHAARRMAPDLVYTWMLQAGVYSLWRGIPTILELHDRVTGTIGPWLFRRFYASKVPRRLLTNTDALRQVLTDEFDLDPAKLEIQVAPNGVELERYQNLPSPGDARRQLGLPEGFTAGYTGHFYAGRGMELMLRLASALPEMKFLWVGGEPADVTFWQECLQREEIHNITLTGFVDNAILPLYQAAAEVLLMPYGRSIAGSGGGNSAEIASPMKMFEYLAAGRAILSSDLPVIHEVLNEENAIFCPPENLDAWTSALAALRDSPERQAALSSAARQTAASFTWTARAARALADFI